MSLLRRKIHNEIELCTTQFAKHACRWLVPSIANVHARCDFVISTYHIYWEYHTEFRVSLSGIQNVR